MVSKIVDFLMLNEVTIILAVLASLISIGIIEITGAGINRRTLWLKIR